MAHRIRSYHGQSCKTRLLRTDCRRGSTPSVRGTCRPSYQSTSRSTSSRGSRRPSCHLRSRRRRYHSKTSRNPIPGPHHRTSRRRSNSPGSSRRRPSSRLLGRRHTSASVPTSTSTSTSTSVRGSLEDMFRLQLAHMLLASRSPLQLAHMLSASTSTSTSLGSSTRGNLPRRRLAVRHYSKP